jgi:O-antigen/teichoic acid export membrane protein
MLVNLFLLPVISAYLTPSDYEIFGLVMIYSSLLSVFSNLGFFVLFQNAYYREPETYKIKWADYFGFQQLYKILYGSIVALILFVRFHHELGDTVWLVITLVVVPVIFLDMTRMLGTRLSQFQHKHKRVYTLTAVSGFVGASITYYTIKELQLGYIGWLWSAFGIAVVQFAFYGYLIFIREKIKPKYRFDFALIKNGISVALPTIPHHYSSYLLSSGDRLIMDASNTNKFDIGQYNLAYGFAGYLEAFSNQLVNIVSPIYYELFAKNNESAYRLIQRFTMLFLAALMLAGFIASIWVKEVFQVLYKNADLASAYPYAVVMILCYTYKPLYTVSVDRAMFEEKTASVLKISLAAGLINILLNAIFIPLYGVWAACIITVVTYLYMGASGHFFKSTKKFIRGNYYVIPWLVLVILLILFVYWIRDYGWIFKLILTASALTFSVWAYFIKFKPVIAEINTLRNKSK